MTFKEAKQRQDYSFQLNGIENFVPEIRKKKFDVFEDEQEENGVAEWGLAVLRIGWLDLEVNLEAKCNGNGRYKNEPYPCYFACVKGKDNKYHGLINEDDWSDAGYLDDLGFSMDVDWSKRNWASLLEKDMFEKLSQFAEKYGLSFDKANWVSKANRMSVFDRIHGIA